MKKSLALSVIVFLSSFQAFAASAEEEKELNYWKQTNLSFNLVEQRYLNDQNCLASESRFLGCVDGLVLLGVSQKNGEYLTLASSRHSFRKEDVIFSMGDLHVVKDRHYLDMKEQKLTGVAAYKSRQAYDNEKDRVWRLVYNARTTLNMPFSRVFRELAAKTALEKEAMTSGLVINKYLASVVDPHTYVQPIQKSQDELANGDSTTVGIGVVIEGNGDLGFLVRKVIEDGPAYKAGMRERDVIVKIEGKEVTGMTTTDAVELIRGNEGTNVRVEVKRDQQVISLVINRAPVVFPNFTSKVITGANGIKIGYTSLGSFMGNNVCYEFTEALIRFQRDSAVKGAVVDLRGNGGGLVSLVGCMLDAFLPQNKIVLATHDPATNRAMEMELTKDPRVYFTKTVVVLVDGYSASASEVFAGGVQDHKLGYVVGARTFGKGTIQGGTREYGLEGLVMMKTRGRFHLPSGRTNQLVGVIPDFEAYRSPNPTEEDMFYIREEDRYRNVIPTGPTERTVFHNRLNTTKACFQRSDANRKKYTKEEDYQLLVAQDVLACDAAPMIPLAQY